MTEYSEADFANATFARSRCGDPAVRWDSDSCRQWWVDGDAWRSDQEMADMGATPVREATDLETMLEQAWNEGEVPTDGEEFIKARRGDQMIRKGGPLYVLHVVDQDEAYFGVEAWRIHKLAPRPEPWQDLADDLEKASEPGWEEFSDLAVRLHAAGWRKGGDDK